MGKSLHQKCTKSRCTTDNIFHTLDCQACHRHVHYYCTKLPKYQIALLLQAHARFTCQNCVTIPPHLQAAITIEDDYKENPKDLKKKIEKLEQEKTKQEDLRKNIEKLQQEKTKQEDLRKKIEKLEQEKTKQEDLRKKIEKLENEKKE